MINKRLQNFSKIAILPRWIIFIIDLGLVVTSFLFSFIIRADFHLEIWTQYPFFKSLSFYLLLQISLFLLFKVYAGIIRFTGIQDAFRILAVVVFANAGMAIFNLFSLQYENQLLVPFSVIVINCLLSFVMLTAYRILVKKGFSFIIGLSNVKKRVAIYGAGEVGISTKRALEHDLSTRMQVCFFLEDNVQKTGKNIDGIKILPAIDIKQLVREYDIDELIISTTKIPPKLKNEIVDFCLEHKINVFVVPPLKNWINGQLNTKQLQNVKIEDLLEREQIKIYNEIIFNQLFRKVVLVTGAAGSIGSEIVRQLIQYKPAKIIINDYAETPLHDLKLELDELGFKQYQIVLGDIRVDAVVDYIFEEFKPHFVYHAAAYKHVPMMEQAPAESIRTNVMGTKKLADKSQYSGVERFVMISTDKAVNPTNVMGASKRLAEIYVQALNDQMPGTKFITTRFGNVLGSNGSVIPRFKKQIESGGPITVTHPSITRFFMTIPEACQLVLEAGSMGNGGEIFVFDMGQSVKIVDLAKKMIKLSGLEPEQDIKIEFTGLRPGEKLYEELLNNAENTLATYHDKIMIAKTRKAQWDMIKSGTDNIIQLACGKASSAEIVSAMKYMVPEYISNNSEFEALDKKNNTPIISIQQQAS